MKLMIESTDLVTIANGVLCRVWRGTTEGGASCTLLVHRIAVANAEDQGAFERELLATMAPVEVCPVVALPEALS